MPPTDAGEEGLARDAAMVQSDRAAFDRDLAHAFLGPDPVFVALTAELPEPGCFVTRAIGRHPVIVARDPRGAVTVLPNRCSHRGVALTRAPEGRGLELICPYHGWAYDLSGRLLRAPTEPWFGRAGHPRGDAYDHPRGLTPLVSVIRRGLVFAGLEDQVAEPVLDDWPDFEGVAIGERERTVLQQDWREVLARAEEAARPNLILERTGDGVALCRLEPLGPAETALHWTRLAAPSGPGGL